MRYLVSVIFDAPGDATPDEMAAIDVFNDRLQAEGHWVFAAGLGEPSTATVIDNRDGEAVFTDGPFVESKDRGAWDTALIAEGHRLVRERLAAGVAPGRRGGAGPLPDSRRDQLR